jgi:hypothetical protein
MRLTREELGLCVGGMLNGQLVVFPISKTTHKWNPGGGFVCYIRTNRVHKEGWPIYQAE